MIGHFPSAWAEEGGAAYVHIGAAWMLVLGMWVAEAHWGDTDSERQVSMAPTVLIRKWKDYYKSIHTLTLPSTVTRIGKAVFGKCFVSRGLGITELAFSSPPVYWPEALKLLLQTGKGQPASHVDLHQRWCFPFASYRSPKEFIVSPDNPCYASKYGELYTKDFKTKLYFTSERMNQQFCMGLRNRQEMKDYRDRNLKRVNLSAQVDDPPCYRNSWERGDNRCR